MRATRGGRWSVGASLVAGSLLVLAQAGLRPAQAQFGKPKGPDVTNLGALGAGGEVSGAGIAVKAVYEGPGKRAGLAVGDTIVKVYGRPLQAGTPDPILQLIAALERAELKGKPFELGIQRGGADKTLKLRLAKLGKHSKSCPQKCKKCAKVVRAGLAFLQRTQAGNGAFPTELGGKTGLVVVTSLGGLAFLAAGVSPRSPAITKAIAYVLGNANVNKPSPFAGARGGGGNWNQTNWELSYALCFLSEAARLTRRGDLKAKCRELAAKLWATMEGSGGWAHGPGGPNALGYLELEIVSNYALLGLGAAQRLGIEPDATKLAKALTWIEGTSRGDGGVGYSQRSGQKGFGDPGRTAGALVAYAALGQRRRPFFGKMASFYMGRLGKLSEGHVSPAMHLLAGAMASHVLGGKSWKAYMQTYRLHLMGARKPDGSFASTPTKESRSMRNNTDLTVGPRWTTATYVLILSLPNKKLPFLLGGKAKAEKTARKRRRTGG